MIIFFIKSFQNFTFYEKKYIKMLVGFIIPYFVVYLLYGAIKAGYKNRTI